MADDYALPKTVIVLLVMIGAAAAVCCGYAIHSFAVGFEPGGNGIKPLSSEQGDYMREVRARNLEALAVEGHKYMRTR
ncbi:hypothetical protein K505DRAFT_236194 [Melanomma pulvis-pyrius CBS 109.77]|uniref:Uncharacterized protein n=1 Tax=Melanomma pulvis-pyrius CBS 109.77 TaxID=1314802 RepID=A0A6A6XLT5_9PLEO|nr:hypothetical protein K505DRAFT_236194 [Melanomma pulvis-pyrius CBS 109.77]